LGFLGFLGFKKPKNLKNLGFFKTQFYSPGQTRPVWSSCARCAVAALPQYHDSVALG